MGGDTERGESDVLARLLEQSRLQTEALASIRSILRTIMVGVVAVLVVCIVWAVLVLT